MHPTVFSINSGRSGSYYLYRLLDTAANVTAFHEPLPDGAGRYTPLFPAGRPNLVDTVLGPLVRLRKRRKIAAIERTLAGLPPGQIYAETNHMFILSFYTGAMARFPSSTVVILRRYLPRVLKSFVELDYFSTHAQTKFWYTSANIRSAAVRALAPDREMDPVDRSIAYLIDIEGRAQRFKRQYPHARTIDARLEELNGWDGAMRLFTALGAEPTDATRQLLEGGGPRNEKSTEKGVREVSEEFCRDRILQYVETCRTRGIVLPELPAMVKL
jgi:hypothetical protein